MRGTIEERFWAKVDKNGPVHPVLGTRCHLWTGAPDSHGYGTIGAGHKTLKAHRVAWVLFVGPIPEGEGVLHRCDVRLCVNYVEHLFTGTPGDNMRDRTAKGRSASGDRHGSATHPGAMPRGEAHWNARLKRADVDAIRERYVPGYGAQSALAREYGVARGVIRRIVNRETWV